MEVVKLFNSELSSLYEAKPPISKAKMTSITRTAIKAIKFYKHVVQSVEKFIQKCKPEYKVPGLYVIDSIVRQSRHQFGTEKDVFAPRFARNLQTTFIHLFNCPPEDKSKVIRVLNLWQKNSVFESDVIQPLFDLADPNHPIHKEQSINNVPSNGITPSKLSTNSTKTPPSMKSSSKDATASWANQSSHMETASLLTTPLEKKHTPSSGQQSSMIDVNLIQQLQQLQTLLDQRTDNSTTPNKKESDQVKFDKKLLDFDYGEEEDEDTGAGSGNVIAALAQSHSQSSSHHQQHQQHQQQVSSSLDSLGSILSNPEVLRQLQNLQVQLSQQQLRQQYESEEKMRKLQEMRQQEEEFDKHLAQTVPNLPFADECDFKPNQDISPSMSLHHQAFMSQIQGLNFPGMDLSQPPPGYGMTQQKLMGSPLEDGEHASSDLDERIGIRKNSEEGGGAVVIIDSESPSDSPAHRRRRRRSNSRSHHRSRSDSRSRSRSKRKRSRSYEKEHDKDYDRTKDRELEKEKERERRRKGLPPLKKNHLAVCSTTLWIGHLSKLVQQEELSDTFGEYGDIVSIDLIPPRGCAFICMNRRQDAHKALQQLRHHKLQGKAITLAWAPGKGMKGKEWKDYWEVEQGVSFIPWNKISRDIDLEILEEGGMLDEESFPDWLREKQRKIKEEQQKSQNSSQTGDEDKSESNKLSGASELDIPVPAPTLPGYIPLPDGPQPNDIKTSQAPPSMPAMMPPAPTAMPPLGMMPPFGIHNVPRLLGPMGMTMGPAGLMPNVPMGVPPPGLMANQLMHQQMMSRMPQPVGSPFNAPPGLLGHPQLSQIPLPTPQGQDANKARLMSTSSADLSSFTESMLQLPFTLPPQLQLQAGGIGVIQSQLATLDRPSTPMDVDSDPNTSKEDETSTPSRSLNNSMANSPFNRPPPHFSPMSLMQIPPPMNLPPPNKAIESNNNSTDKDEREGHDKDYRSGSKETRGVRDEKEKDFRSNRGKDGDYKNYRDRNDKDFRERDSRDRSRDHEYRDRDRRDTRRDRDRNSNDKNDSEMRNNRDSRSKEAEDGKENELKRDKGPNARDDDDRGYRDRSRNRDRDRDRDRNRDRGGRWNDRDKEKDDRSRERLNQSGRDKDSGKRKDDQSDNRDKSIPSLQERLRNLAHDQNRAGEFSRRGRSPVNENMIPPLLPPTGGMDPNDMPFHGPPRGPMFGSRNMGDGFGPQDLHNRHPDEFGHRGGPRGSRDGFDGRGPSRGSMPPEDFDSRGPPPLNNFNPRGPPPDGFDPRGPPPDGFDPRGPPHEGFGAPMEGFGPPRPGPPPGFNPQGSEDFHPRIRIEFFPRRGMGHPDNFMRMKGRGPMGPGPLFPPRGPPPGPMGMRGPRPGMWMDGPGFPPRGFPPPDGPPTSEEFFRRSPVFEESGRGRGETNARGMARGRGFQGRSSERRKEEGEGKRSRWSNASPSPPRQSKSPVSADTPTMKTEDSKQHEDLPTGEKLEDNQNIKHKDNSRLSEIITKSEENINIDNVSDISVKHESVSECQKLEIRSTVTELPLFVKFKPTEETSLTETLQELGPSCTESIKERRTSNTEPIPIQKPSYSEPLQERRASNTEPMTEHHSPHAETDISENKNESIFPEFEHELAPPSNQHEQKLPTIVKLEQNLPEDKVQDSYLTKHEPYSFLEEKKPVVRSIDTSCLPDQERRLSSTEQEREITLMEQEEVQSHGQRQQFLNQNEQLSFVDETSNLPPVQTQSFCESDFDIEPRNSDDQDFLCPLSELPEESIMPDIPSAIETVENEFRIETSDQEITKPVNTVESYTTTSDETDIEK